MQTLQISLGVIVAVVLAAVLLRRHAATQRRRSMEGNTLFADVLPLMGSANLSRGEAIGSWILTGLYREQPFQLQSVTDTLSTRKLPSLWLMITLPRPQAVPATIDMMMRPSAATTFSNFDFLTHTLPRPQGFPETAIIRSDQENCPLPVDDILPHLALFTTSKGKELLITPKGLRIVVQIAEADRARYGVLREANFGTTVIDRGQAQALMDMLIKLQDDLARDG
jgi:hypothetical protein